jgi:Ferritin-like domain
LQASLPPRATDLHSPRRVGRRRRSCARLLRRWRSPARRRRAGRVGCRDAQLDRRPRARGRHLGGNARAYAREIKARQTDHADRLSALIRAAGGSPPTARPASSYAPEFPRLTSAADTLQFARDLEERLLRAYLEASALLSDSRQRHAVADIAAAQAEQLSVVHVLAGEPAAPQPFVTGTS